MKRILITGSREWPDASIIHHAIDNWIRENVPPMERTIVVHGDASRGADRMARDYVRSSWWLVEEAHPANWEQLGKSAGFVRNQYMVDLGADVCLAFIYKGSAGASHTAQIAEQNNILTIRHLDTGETTGLS